MSKSKVIGIVGTGDYGRALAKRLLRAGYEVIMGSRKPDSQRLTSIDEELAAVRVDTIKEVLADEKIEIVILAVHFINYSVSLASSLDIIGDKIIIDPSNQDKLRRGESNAEKLAESFPGLRVVKAFNTLSAYAMESDTFGGSKQVLIASNDQEARDKVSSLTREMGFTPVDYGTLRSARELESYPLSLMNGWGWPTIFTVAVFVGWNLVLVGKYSTSTSKFDWDHLALSYLNKPVCLTAMTLLGLSYLPGCLAAFLQIINGTKYKRFPKWFDDWLKARKMLGLYALFFSAWHVAISILFMGPGHVHHWFESTKVAFPENTSGFVHDFSVKMTSRGEATVSVGLLAFFLMCIVGLSSLPSVGAVLNWREWRFVQSHLGYVTLFLSVAHVVIFAYHMWSRDPVKMIYGRFFMSCVIPFLALLMKLILATPCVGGYVDKIRGGWERGRSYETSDANVELKSVYTKPAIATVG